MINTKIFDRLLTIELRNGVGIDLEFVDSKAVWVYNHLTEEHSTMPFEGVVILLPFLSITYGRPYTEAE
jgi:hypothetical protein|tara:strand:+ start:530 stop:736 length:207 start_codon:yes stop_codon:yes gene_type:complete